MKYTENAHWSTALPVDHTEVITYRFSSERLCPDCNSFSQKLDSNPHLQNKLLRHPDTRCGSESEYTPKHMAIKMLILTLKIRHVKSTCNFLRLLREKKKSKQPLLRLILTSQRLRGWEPLNLHHPLTWRNVCIINHSESTRRKVSDPNR